MGDILGQKIHVLVKFGLIDKNKSSIISNRWKVVTVYHDNYLFNSDLDKLSITTKTVVHI